MRAVARTLMHRDVHRELRSYLQQRFSADDVLLYGSGTHALTAAMDIALEHATTRVVALPGFACFDLATAAIGAHARVVLYDVDPTTLAPDWDSFDAALTAGACAAVVAPLFGVPIDWDRAETIALRHGVALIEDAAQAAGGEWRGRPIGSLGMLSVLSFGRGKGWTGSGGGALLLRGSVHARTIAHRTPIAPSPSDSLRAFMSACAQMLLSHPLVYGIPAALPFLHLGETRYKAPTPLRAMNRFSAGLAFATAECSSDERRRRTAVAETYASQLAGMEEVFTCAPSTNCQGAPGWLRYPLLAATGMRARLLRAFAHEGAAASYPIALRHLPELQPHLHAVPSATPGADRLAEALITFPTHARARWDLGARVRAFFVSQSEPDSVRK